MKEAILKIVKDVERDVREILMFVFVIMLLGLVLGKMLKDKR